VVCWLGRTALMASGVVARPTGQSAEHGRAAV